MAKRHFCNPGDIIDSESLILRIRIRCKTMSELLILLVMKGLAYCVIITYEMVLHWEQKKASECIGCTICWLDKGEN